MKRIKRLYTFSVNGILPVCAELGMFALLTLAAWRVSDIAGLVMGALALGNYAYGARWRGRK